MKNNIKLIFAFIIGLFVAGSISLVLAVTYRASDITYTPTDNTWNVSNVQGAINDLHNIAPNGPTKERAQTGATHKGIVYLDPTDLTKTCTIKDADRNVNNNGTPTEIKEGCMRWYIYAEDSNNYTMILDHNTTAKVQWNTNNINVSYEDSLVKEYVDNLVTINHWQVTPRLISASEIKTITGNTNFNL